MNRLTATKTSAAMYRQPLTIAMLLCGIGLQACTNHTDAPVTSAAATASGPAASAAVVPMAVVAVTTGKAQMRNFPVTLVANGTVQAINTFDVRAQTTSTVRQVHFREGDFVKTGQLLFSLDSRTDEANLAKAVAQLARDNAGLADARRQYARAKQLFDQHFVSQGAVDTALSQVEGLEAAAQADQAAVDGARVALSFDRVTSPGNGRAGQVAVSAGAAVQANVTSLVTLVQLAPIEVAFNIPQRNLPDALAALPGAGAPVSAVLPDKVGTFQGRLRFVDNLVDSNSGTVKAKAEFPNTDGKLWPGAYVQVQQTIGDIKNAVVIPEAAIVQGPRGAIVYTVKDGHATLQPITVQYAQNGEAAVTGVHEGDVVVMDGKQNLRPNAPVAEKQPAPAVAVPQ